MDLRELLRTDCPLFNRTTHSQILGASIGVATPRHVGLCRYKAIRDLDIWNTQFTIVDQTNRWTYLYLQKLKQIIFMCISLGLRTWSVPRFMKLFKDTIHQNREQQSGDLRKKHEMQVGENRWFLVLNRILEEISLPVTKTVVPT